MTREEYERTMARIEEWLRQSPDRRDIEFRRLLDAVEAYENEHYPMPPPSYWSMLRFRQDQVGFWRGLWQFVRDRLR